MRIIFAALFCTTAVQAEASVPRSDDAAAWLEHDLQTCMAAAGASLGASLSEAQEKCGAAGHYCRISGREAVASIQLWLLTGLPIRGISQELAQNWITATGTFCAAQAAIWQSQLDGPSAAGAYALAEVPRLLANLPEAYGHHEQ